MRLSMSLYNIYTNTNVLTSRDPENVTDSIGSVAITKGR